MKHVTYNPRRIDFHKRLKKLMDEYAFEISYGSLKETKYLVYFACKQNYLDKKIYRELSNLADEIGAMLWGTLRRM